VAHLVMRHRVVKNYRAEAESISINAIIDEFLKAKI